MKDLEHQGTKIECAIKTCIASDAMLDIFFCATKKWCRQEWLNALSRQRNIKNRVDNTRNIYTQFYKPEMLVIYIYT